MNERKFVWKPGDVEIRPATQEELAYLRRKAKKEARRGVKRGVKRERKEK